MHAIIVILLCLSALQTQPNAAVVVLKQTNVSGLLSGSGMATYDDKLYACGDDDPYLFMLNHQGYVEDSFHIYKAQSKSDVRISKAIKPDFEAVAAYETEDEKGLLVFGSGSKALPREVIVKLTDLPHNVSITTYQVSTLYSYLKRKLHIKHADFNIEGASTWDNNIILLNRGDNSLITFPLQDLLEYLNENDTEIIQPDQYFYELKTINGHSSTFSGASLLPGTHTLTFTASVEVSNNSYDDGAILGSFVGMIDMHRLTDKTPTMHRVAADNGWFTGKIEAIELEVESQEHYIFSAITDDDDGSTRFLKLRYKK